MADLGPISLSVAGDKYLQSARILAVIWSGVTTAGDTVVLSDPYGGGVLWRGRTNDTQTYLGGNFGGEGIAAPNGFTVTQISAGILDVYIREA